jgi:hypothetical protein
MAKLKPDPITRSDLELFIEQESDFAFELKVLKLLIDMGIACEHGGHYRDPIEGKLREFDIRAKYIWNDFFGQVRMAIECKNIRANFPVHVSCTPRRADEAYHYIALYTPDPTDIPTEYANTEGVLPGARLHALKLKRSKSIYSLKEPVGKSTVQVGKDSNGLTSNDSSLFEKWGQSMASLHDLIDCFQHDATKESYHAAFTALPIVVVPNERLWETLYGPNGDVVDLPKLVDRVSCYVGRGIRLNSSQGWIPYGISHVEFMTVNGLESFVNDFLLNEFGRDQLFGL